MCARPASAHQQVADLLHAFPWDRQTNQVVQQNALDGQQVPAPEQICNSLPPTKRQRTVARQPEERYLSAVDVLHGAWDSHVDMATRASTLTNSDILLVRFAAARLLRPQSTLVDMSLSELHQPVGKLCRCRF